MRYEVKYRMEHGDECPFCDQELHVEDGVFQCGGDGEGICSFWIAVNAFGQAVKRLPPYATIDGERWIDAWVVEEVGQSWAEIGWDRFQHLAAVREIWNLPSGVPPVPAGQTIVFDDDQRTVKVTTRSADTLMIFAAGALDREKAGILGEFLLRFSSTNTRDLALLVWFCARGASRAGQFIDEQGQPDVARGSKAREEFDAWWKGYS